MGKFTKGHEGYWPGKKAHNNKQIELICKICGTKYKRSPSRIKTSKFCSRKCTSKWVAINKLKEYRFKKGVVSVNKGKSNLKMMGVNNPNWKGGRTDLTEKIRKSYKYNNWRLEVFLRDKHTCQICGKQEHNGINADHFPKGFAYILEENGIKSFDDALQCQDLWNLNNGRTLCIDCHRKTETYFTNYLSKKYIYG